LGQTKQGLQNLAVILTNLQVGEPSNASEKAIGVAGGLKIL
jgi:hypothetical protein